MMQPLHHSTRCPLCTKRYKSSQLFLYYSHFVSHCQSDISTLVIHEDVEYQIQQTEAPAPPPPAVAVRIAASQNKAGQSGEEQLEQLADDPVLDAVLPENCNVDKSDSSWQLRSRSVLKFNQTTELDCVSTDDSCSTTDSVGTVQDDFNLCQRVAVVVLERLNLESQPQTSHSASLQLSCGRGNKAKTKPNRLLRSSHKPVMLSKSIESNSTASSSTSSGEDNNDALDRQSFSKKTFQCRSCSRSFLRNGDLKVHQRVHTGDKPYHCGQCPRRYALSGDLRRHLLAAHNDHRPYSCRRCDMRFTREFDLRCHQRSHTGDKPFQCSQCGMGFAHSSTLAKHTRVHTGERPYRCSICGARFTLASSLANHKRLHTGERPFMCRLCNSKFSQASTLSKHYRIHSR